jgi:hypothetical protein
MCRQARSEYPRTRRANRTLFRSEERGADAGGRPEVSTTRPHGRIVAFLASSGEGSRGTQAFASARGGHVGHSPPNRWTSPGLEVLSSQRAVSWRRFRSRNRPPAGEDLTCRLEPASTDELAKAGFMALSGTAIQAALPRSLIRLSPRRGSPRVTFRSPENPRRGL